MLNIQKNVFSFRDAKTRKKSSLLSRSKQFLEHFFWLFFVFFVLSPQMGQEKRFLFLCMVRLRDGGIGSGQNGKQTHPIFFPAIEHAHKGDKGDTPFSHPFSFSVSVVS